MTREDLSMGANVPSGAGSSPAGQDEVTDVVVIGAGVIGIYQLYLARQAGYSVQMIEAGSGVGGTWYWNRYPGARYDSESYTYAYLFSEELFQEWEWTEHFSGQAENERYFNHVVDKFDLRRHIRFNTRVTSAVWDESTATYLVQAGGYAVRARFLVAATGVLSVPTYPDVPGRESFRGEAYHTGLWPKAPVDFAGKRVAVVGTGSSGVQIIPVIAGEVASLTVYQRTPNWATPLNNRPITPQEQAELKANFAAMRETLRKSMTGFLHVHSTRKTFDDSPGERREHYEKAWRATGFGTLIINYSDMMLDPAANAEWAQFVASKIRAVVDDPAVADKLIPADHAYGGKRPPFVTGYYEAYNRPNVSLIDLKETPITAVTETGIETAAGPREFDIIVWATGFDFGTGALNRLGVRGTDGLPLKEYWADGPLTYLGIMSHHFPNFFYPAGPHGAAGNNPRYGGDQVDFVAGLIDYAREHGYQRIEVPARLEKEWTDMVNTEAVRRSSFTESSYFYGSNIPGKARRFLLNPLGRPKLLELMETAIKNNYAGFFPAGDGDQ
jgi:cation diffusion facilitator CzcD-associated flavoprotein CzcO